MQKHKIDLQPNQPYEVLPIRTCCWPSTPLSLRSIVIVNIACEREECSFMFVAPTEPSNTKTEL